MNSHICEYLAYNGQSVKLVNEGEKTQHHAMFDYYDRVMLLVVLFCPYCGEDFRSQCLRQIPGRSKENSILNRARLAGEAKDSSETK